jgi:hypothetical protein
MEQRRRYRLVKISVQGVAAATALFWAVSALAVEVQPIDYTSPEAPGPIELRAIDLSTPEPGTSRETPTVRVNPVEENDSNPLAPSDRQRREELEVEPVPSPVRQPIPRSQQHLRAYPPLREVSAGREEMVPSRQSHTSSDWNRAMRQEERVPIKLTPDEARVIDPNVASLEPKKLTFKMVDLIKLNEAAVKAGGKLNVSIAPVGITVEDLIVPLREQGYFDVQILENSNQVLVSSKENAGNSLLEKEITQLQETRRRLMNDIAALEKTKSQYTPVEQKIQVMPSDAPAPSPYASAGRNESYRGGRVAQPLLSSPVTVTLSPTVKVE